MRVVYLAHSVAAKTPEGVMGNIARARRWYRKLCDTQPDCAFVANWIIDVEVFHDADSNVTPDVIVQGEPEHKDRLKGLSRDDAVIRVCDEYWMVGGRITWGMLRGLDVAMVASTLTADLTHLGDEPPDEMPLIDDTYFRIAREKTA